MSETEGTVVNNDNCITLSLLEDGEIETGKANHPHSSSLETFKGEELIEDDLKQQQRIPSSPKKKKGNMVVKIIEEEEEEEEEESSLHEKKVYKKKNNKRRRREESSSSIDEKMKKRNKKRRRMEVEEEEEEESSSSESEYEESDDEEEEEEEDEESEDEDDDDDEEEDDDELLLSSTSDDNGVSYVKKSKQRKGSWIADDDYQKITNPSQKEGSNEELNEENKKREIYAVRLHMIKNGSKIKKVKAPYGSSREMELYDETFTLERKEVDIHLSTMTGAIIKRERDGQLFSIGPIFHTYWFDDECEETFLQDYSENTVSKKKKKTNVKANK